jgi:membrane-associated phospholipid phosphatase
VPAPSIALSDAARSVSRVAERVAREHFAVIAIVIGYVAAGGAVLHVLGRPWPLELANAWFTKAWVAVSAALLAGERLRSRRSAAVALHPVRVGGAFLVALLIVPFQTTFQGLKESIGPIVGFPFDPMLARLAELVHGGPAWQLLDGVFRFPRLILLLDALYMLWFPLVFLVIVWLSWSTCRVLRIRALVSFLLIWIAGGTIAAWAFASAGPCYSQLPQYVALVRRLDHIGFPLLARINQRGLWQAEQLDRLLPFGGVSAMPSMHVAIAVWMAIVTWARSRSLGVLFAVYACSVQIGSVVLGWHYGIDGYAGAAIAFGAWAVCKRVLPTNAWVPARAPASSSSYSHWAARISHREPR